MDWYEEAQGLKSPGPLGTLTDPIFVGIHDLFSQGEPVTPVSGLLGGKQLK